MTLPRQNNTDQRKVIEAAEYGKRLTFPGAGYETNNQTQKDSHEQTYHVEHHDPRRVF